MIAVRTALDAAQSSGTDTEWVVRAGLISAMVVPLLAVLWLMRRAWRAKAAGQAQWPEPSDLPGTLSEGGESSNWRLPATQARYLGSSQGGDWLARVVVHDLGVPSKALLAVDDSGVWVERQGARSFWVPAPLVLGARSDRGIAGRAYEQDGVTVITWRLGDIVVDSGFRITEPEVQAAVLCAIDGLASAGQPCEGGQS